MKRRVLVLFLALAMLLPMCPMAVGAEETAEPQAAAGSGENVISDVYIDREFWGNPWVKVVYSLEDADTEGTLVAASFSADGRMTDSSSVSLPDDTAAPYGSTNFLFSCCLDLTEDGWVEAFLLDKENNVLSHMTRQLPLSADVPEGGSYLGTPWYYEDGLLYIRAEEPSALLGYEERFNGWGSLKYKVRSLYLTNITSLPGYAFSDFTALEKVVDTTDTLEEIGMSAFQNCTALSYIQLNRLRSVSYRAFWGCTQLKSMPENLEAVEAKAFENCAGLDYAKLEHIRKLGEGAFAGSGIGSATISMETLKEIPDEAFAGCRNLTNVMFQDVPETGFSVGEEAFADAIQLRSADFFDSLTAIGKNAFRNTHLDGIFLPETVTEIPGGAFADCRFMDRVVLSNVKDIASCAFQKSVIGTLYLTVNLEKIEENAFLDAKIGQLEVSSDFDWSIVAEEGNEALLALRPVEETAAVETMEETVPETTEETVPETTEETVSEITEETLTPEEAAGEGMYLAPEGASMADSGVLEEMAFFLGSDRTVGEAHTASFTGLASSKKYLLVVSREPGSLKKEDLQYIGLASSDETGSLTARYIPRSDISAIVALYGPAAPAELRFREERITLKKGETVYLHPNVPESEYDSVHFSIQTWDGVPAFVLDRENMALRLNEELELGGLTRLVLRAWIGEETEARQAVIQVIALSDDMDAYRVALDQDTATVNPYSTAAVELPISLLYAPERKNAETFALEEEENGDARIAVTGAKFVREDMNGLFALEPRDDHTLLLTVKDPDAVKKSSYSSKLLVTVGEKSFETGLLKLTVKKSLPKLTAKALSFNSFYRAAPQWVNFTGAEVDRVDLAPYARQNRKVLDAFQVSTEGGLQLIPKTTDKSFSGTLTADVIPAGYNQPVKVTVSVKVSEKAPSLKLLQSALTVNTGSSFLVVLVRPGTKGVSVAELGISGVEMYRNGEKTGGTEFNSSTGELLLTPGYWNRSAEKLSLRFRFEGSDRYLDLPLKITYADNKLKLSKTGLTVNKNYRDVGVITAQYASTGTWVGGRNTYDAVVTDNRRSIVGPEELSVSVSTSYPLEIRITPGKNADPGKTYTVNLYPNWFENAGSAARFTVKITDKAVTAAPKVIGKLDSLQPQNTVTVKPNFKNLTGLQEGQIITDWELLDLKERVCSYCVDGKVQPDGSLRLAASPFGVLSAGKYTLKLTYTLGDGTSLERSVPVNVTKTYARLKLGKTSVVLNPNMEDAEVSATVAAKGYGETNMGMTVRDSSGREVDDYGALPFEVHFADKQGKVILRPLKAHMPEQDTTYRLTLFPDRRAMEKNGAELTVKVLGAASCQNQKAALTVAGTLDAADWDSTVTVTPKITGVDTEAYYQSFRVRLESSTDGKNYTEIENFAAEPTDSFFETGKITLSQKDISLNPALKYRVTVTYRNGEGLPFATGTAQLKVKQTASKLKAEGSAVIQSLAPYYLTNLQLTNTVPGQNPIASVRVRKAGSIGAYYDAESRLLMLFTNESLTPGKRTVVVPLEVFLEGNETEKPNGTVSIKVTIR